MKSQTDKEKVIPKSPAWWEDYYYNSFDFFYSPHKIFHINRLSETVRVSQLRYYPLPPYRKAVYDFMFVTKGEINRSKSIDSYIIGKNTFFVLPAYQLTTITSISPDADGYYCHFNMDIFNKHFYPNELINHFPFLKYVGNPIIKIDDNTGKFLVTLLERLEHEYRKEDYDLDFAASTILTIFFELNHFTNKDSKIVQNAASKIAESYKNLIIQHVQEKHKISYYADLLSVTPEYLNRCVKSTYGKTSKDLLNEIIILEAKVLLKQSIMNVGEIAFKLQDKSPSDFIRFFKAKTGYTPREYRSKV
jgi:AraC family transcriptional regulator, transcriptional activator of pobA